MYNVSVLMEPRRFASGFHKTCWGLLYIIPYLNCRLLTNGLMAKFNLKGKNEKLAFEKTSCYRAVMGKTIQYFMLLTETVQSIF